MDGNGETDPNSRELPDISREDLDEPDWKIYQKIVAGLYANEDTRVETEYEYPIPGSGKKEIDVVVWDQSEHFEYTVLIECKFQSEPVPQSTVDSMNGYFRLSDADKAVIVSKAGFQSGAVKRAEGTGVELLRLRRFMPDEDLHEEEVQFLDLNLNVRRRNLDIVNMDFERLDEDPDAEEKKIQYRFNRQNSQLYTTNKEPLGDTLIDRLTEFKRSKNTGTHTKNFDEISLLIEGEFFQLHSLTYKLTESVGSTDYLMNLFENVDLHYKNELTGDEEYESLSEAIARFRSHVGDD